MSSDRGTPGTEPPNACLCRRRPGVAGTLPRAGGAALLAFALHGCIIAEPQVTLIPVEEKQPAATAEPAQTDTPKSPQPGPVATLDPKRAGEQVAERTRELIRRDELRLSRAEAGYYMDVQEAQLRQLLRARPVDIFRDADSLLIRISGSSAFPVGSSEIGPGLRELLVTIADVLGEYRKTLVVVNSHTDQDGDAEFNQRLSEARALAVSRFLAERGITPDRLAAIGHGESKPLSRFAGSAGPNLNRRLELRLQLLVEQTS